MNILERMIKQLIDDAYQRGFSAGVNAEILKEQKELNERERYLYEYGYKMGVEDTKAENCIIEEISTEEFDRLAGQSRTEIPEGFGFVGTIDDISLVLDEEAV